MCNDRLILGFRWFCLDRRDYIYGLLLFISFQAGCMQYWLIRMQMFASSFASRRYRTLNSDVYTPSAIVHEE